MNEVNYTIMDHFFSERIQGQPRIFIEIECTCCKETFFRESHLICHLELSPQCLISMGGSIPEAREIIRKQKRAHRYYSDVENEKESRRVRYKANPEPEREARRKRYNEDIEKERQNRQNRYQVRALERFLKMGRYGPSFPCVVCHELHWQNNVIPVDFEKQDDNFICKDYIVKHQSLFVKLNKYYCCKTCQQKIGSEELPANAAKNSLECPWDEVPRELLKLSEVFQ